MTPHQVGARLGYGPIPAGATVLHDCEVRLCCRAAPGHLRVGTQSENMRQAVARGRAVGPRPGRVDVRGKAGASRAIQAALLAATDRSPAGLAAVLAAVIAEGDPLAGPAPVVRPARAPRAGTGVRGRRGPGGGGAGVAAAAGAGRVAAAVRRVTSAAACRRQEQGTSGGYRVPGSPVAGATAGGWGCRRSSRRAPRSGCGR